MLFQFKIYFLLLENKKIVTLSFIYKKLFKKIIKNINKIIKRHMEDTITKNKEILIGMPKYNS